MIHFQDSVYLLTLSSFLQVVSHQIFAALMWDQGIYRQSIARYYRVTCSLSEKSNVENCWHRWSRYFWAGSNQDMSGRRTTTDSLWKIFNNRLSILIVNTTNRQYTWIEWKDKINLLLGVSGICHFIVWQFNSSIFGFYGLRSLKEDNISGKNSPEELINYIESHKMSSAGQIKWFIIAEDQVKCEMEHHIEILFSKALCKHRFQSSPRTLPSSRCRSGEKTKITFPISWFSN